MALSDPFKSTIHKKRHGSDHSSHQSIRLTRQTPMLLFQDEQVDSLVNVTGATPQMDGSILQFQSSCTTKRDELFVVFSPGTTKKTTPVPPNAPIKPKRLFSKVGLKPKKLYFLDKERNSSKAAQDKNCDDKRANYSIRSTNSGPSRETRLTRRNESRNSSAMLQNLQFDKENRKYDRKMQDEKKFRNNIKSSNNGAHSSRQYCNVNLQDLRKTPSVLSQYDNNLDWLEKLLWLQIRRDTGMMIQCCRRKCKKWRYCNDYRDPVDVPRIWYCEMNSDKSIASCFIPEIPNSEEFEEDLIENKYNAGSIVWARVNGYPWWPAIVDDCPEVLRYYELQAPSIIPVKYHVTFFNEYLRHVWLNCNSIKPFIKYKMSNLVKKTVFYSVDYKKQVEEAYALAQKAIPLSILSRLQTFSYVSQLRKMQEFQNKSKICISTWNTKIEDQDDDEIIPVSPINHITLKEFYESSIESSK